MRYKYPKIHNWIVFRKTKDGEYEAYDYMNEESYILGSRIGYFAKHLDGKTDPFSIIRRLSDENVAMLLRRLDKLGFLRRSRFFSASFGELYCTVFTPKSMRRKTTVSAFLNKLLQTLFLPAFIAGSYAFFSKLPKLSGGMVLLNCILGIVGGMILHEIGHMIASLAYGGQVFEAGVMLRIVLPGAYVMMDNSSVKDPLKRAQINAAGIEANLLLSGILFMIASNFAWNSEGFFFSALLNAELALTNLILVDGLDGAGVVSDLLGIESLGTEAKSYCQRWFKGGQAQKHKAPDVVYSTMCFSTVMIQPVYVVMLIFDVWGVVAWLL